VFGENPYAEWHGDLRSLDYHGNDGHDVDMQLPPSEVSSRDDVAPPSAPGVPAADPDLLLIQQLRKQGIPVVAVFLTGRVRGIAPELDAASAFAVAWLPGTEGAGVADVLFKRATGARGYPFSGKLPHAWSANGAEHGGGAPLFPYGYGLAGCSR
jgi:beta-glucosidase